MRPFLRLIRSKKTLMLCAIFSIFLFLSGQWSTDSLCASSPGLFQASWCTPSYLGPGWNLFYHLGGNNPWIPKINAVANADEPLPEGCVVDQAHMLSRHAERYPTKSAGARHIKLLERLQHWEVNLRGSLAFVKSWTYFTDTVNPDFEHLTTHGPYAGTMQSYNTGRKLRQRYSHLVEKDRPTKFWSCGSTRDVDTARYFADGFFGSRWATDGSALLEIIPETMNRGANTLTPGTTCLRYRSDKVRGHDEGYQKLKLWQNTFMPPIIRRLVPEITGARLSVQDIYSMMEMCGFEILARGFSSWCDVFTKKEWLEFEYARDLLHFYRAGPGNEYSAAMGWLWLKATEELISDNATTGVYFSFVHDGDIVPLLSALQVLDEHTTEQSLPTNYVKVNRTWKTSDVVPMGGRVNFERIKCRSRDAEDQQYVRFYINDGLMKLPGVPVTSEIQYGVRVEDFADFVDSKLAVYGEFKDVCGLPDEAPDRITFLHQ